MHILSLALLWLSIFFPGAAQAQTPTPELSRNEKTQLAVCLKEKQFTMHGTATCSACAIQKDYFGVSFSYIPYINCEEQRGLCDQKNIHAYPTWEDKEGNQYRGAIPLQILSDLAKCGPAQEQPMLETPDETEKTAVAGVSTLLTREYLLAALLAGFLSFFAPCLVPLLPAYMSVLTGFTFADLYGLNFERLRGRVFVSSLFFVLGFAIVFTTLGATATFVSRILNAYMTYFLSFSGLVLIVLGLVQTGVIKFDALRFDYAWNVQKKLMHLGFLSATVTGIAAALTWIPCIGPLLSSILLLTARSDSILEGAALLFVYSLGITIPFLLAALFFPTVVDKFREHRLAFHRASIIAGIFMIAFGTLLLINKYRLYLDAVKFLPDIIPVKIV